MHDDDVDRQLKKARRDFRTALKNCDGWKQRVVIRLAKHVQEAEAELRKVRMKTESDKHEKKLLLLQALQKFERQLDMLEYNAENLSPFRSPRTQEHVDDRRAAIRRRMAKVEESLRSFGSAWSGRDGYDALCGYKFCGEAEKTDF